MTISTGDQVTIQAKGITVTGKVLSATDYEEDGGWYIELTEANVPGGYSYWKQGMDGGQILTVNGKKVEG